MPLQRFQLRSIEQRRREHGEISKMHPQRHDMTFA